MNDHTFHRRDSTRKTPGLWPWVLIVAIGIGVVLAGLPAHASESQTPWECSSYTGDTHTRCVETFAEMQRDQVAALQEKVLAQQESINLLKNQLDRQASKNADLQRQLARPPAVVQSVPPLYTYPPVGFSFYLGSPWIYGSPLFYRPYVFGPHYYGLRHWGYSW
jgi:uncharacterized coiled-coil protein SlyX